MSAQGAGAGSAKPPTLGLRFFSPGVSPGYRRRRLTFLGVYLAVVIGALTPAIPGVWSGGVGFLGVPVSFQWVILLLTVVFVALVWLYRSEPPEARISSVAEDGAPEG